MKRCLLMMGLLMAGMTALVLSTAAMQEPQDQPKPDAPIDGVEPQTRGALHEAFAEPAVGTPQPAPIVPKKPPEPIEETPPDEKPEGTNVQWIPGYWLFDDEQADFLWISGFWRDVPPERRWVAGYWNQLDENGWQRVSGYWETIQQTEVEYLPDPPHNIDAGPSTPAPAVESVYTPGCWVHRENRYLWRPGHWVRVQPGWVYVSARYCWTPSGCIFSEGYWDYPLEARGLVFCPVRIDVRLLRQPNWVYRPHYCISTPALFTALFARPAFGHYYFGDYFAPAYHKAGFVAWMDYTVVRNTPSPLFAYYHAHRERDWVSNMKQVYVERRSGVLPPPPSSFSQQTTVINNITNITNVNNNIVINKQNFKVANSQAFTQQMTMVAPMKQVTKINTTIKLQPVTNEAKIAVQKHVAQIQQVAQERKQFDVKHTQAVAKSVKAGGQPITNAVTKLTLPKVAAVATPVDTKGKTHAPPPSPQTPKPVAVKPPPPKEVKVPRLDVKPNVIHPRPVDTVHPKDVKVQPKEIKVQPKEEKKILPKEKLPIKPAVVQPKEEKLPAKPPVVLPKPEKKTVSTPPAKVETKSAPPPPPKIEPKPAPKPDTKPVSSPLPKAEARLTFGPRLSRPELNRAEVLMRWSRQESVI